LDYAEDLRTDVRPYFSGRAVGCIATAAGWPGAVNTLGALRDIVHALRGWPTPLGLTLNSSERLFDQTGAPLDSRTREHMHTLASQVVEFANRFTTRRAGNTDGAQSSHPRPAVSRALVDE